MINKLKEVDEILASYEDWMHGQDGEKCTKARKLLIEVEEELNNLLKPDVVGQSEQLPNGKRVLVALKELSDCFTDEERKTMFDNEA